MTVYAKIKSLLIPEYLTKGKEYEVIEECGDIFFIICDINQIICCEWSGCPHLNGGNWQRIERQDTEGAEGQEYAYPPKGEVKWGHQIVNEPIDNRAIATNISIKTLRDEFAMAAMPLFVPLNHLGQFSFVDAAAQCYAMADAMMKARQQ